MEAAAEAQERDGLHGQILRNIVLSGTVFLCALALALVPAAFDRPTTRLINSVADRSWLFDYFVDASNRYPTFSGVLLIAMVDPDAQGQGLSWVLYGLTTLVLFIRGGLRQKWISNVTQVPAVCGMYPGHNL